MNGNLIMKPSLGFKDAVTTALKNLANLKGRSRRSEFWWFMLVFWIAEEIIGGVMALILPSLASAIIQSLLWGFAFAVTARRLQDGGHSLVWVTVSWISSIALNVYLLTSEGWQEFIATQNPQDMIAALSSPILIALSIIATVAGFVTFIFCCMDGTPGTNKYGESPKYAMAE